MHSLGERLEKRVGDVIQERWIGIEVGQSESLQFKSFPFEVGVKKIHNFAICGPGRDILEVCKNRLCAFAGGLIACEMIW